jgi:hypothetical protein
MRPVVPLSAVERRAQRAGVIAMQDPTAIEPGPQSRRLHTRPDSAVCRHQNLEAESCTTRTTPSQATAPNARSGSPTQRPS